MRVWGVFQPLPSPPPRALPLRLSISADIGFALSSYTTERPLTTILPLRPVISATLLGPPRWCIRSSRKLQGSGRVSINSNSRVFASTHSGTSRGSSRPTAVAKEAQDVIRGKARVLGCTISGHRVLCLTNHAEIHSCSSCRPAVVKVPLKGACMWTIQEGSPITIKPEMAPTIHP